MTRMDLMGIEPLEDLGYRAHIADLCKGGQLVCLICGLPAVGHHVRNKQVYGDRRNLVPLCEGFEDPHHTRGTNAVHQMGKDSFAKKFEREIPNGLQWEAERIDNAVNGGKSF